MVLKPPSTTTDLKRRHFGLVNWYSLPARIVLSPFVGDAGNAKAMR